MPKNFAEDCPVVEVICQRNISGGYPQTKLNVLPVHVDFMLTGSDLTPESSAESLTMVPVGDGKLDPATFRIATMAAVDCVSCKQDGQCVLGEFFRRQP